MKSPRVKQHELKPLELPPDEREEFERVERIVDTTRQAMLLRLENEHKAHLEHLAKVKQDEIDRINKEKLMKKLETVDYTYDHNGKIMIVKKPINPELEEDDTAEPMEEPFHPVIRDKGIADSQRMFRLAKIKFRNDKKFLEDYLSMEDARKYMEFTEDDYQKEWFSQVPQLIDNERNFKIEEHLAMSEGVKLRNMQGDSMLKGDTHSIENRMSVKKYHRLSLDKDLAHRYKATQNGFNYALPKMTLTLSGENNDEYGIQKSTKEEMSINEASKSHRSDSRPITQNTYRSRNDKHLITYKTHNAVNLLTQTKPKLKNTNLENYMRFSNTQSTFKSAYQFSSKRATTPRVLYQEFMQSTNINKRMGTAELGFRTHRTLKSTVGSTSSTVGHATVRTNRYA